jgi:hypothetical protein
MAVWLGALDKKTGVLSVERTATMKVELHTADLAPVVLVSVVYVVLYYTLLFAQSYSKVWLINQSTTGSGSLAYSKLNYSSPAVALVKCV